jgi:hypothetical protein
MSKVALLNARKNQFWKLPLEKMMLQLAFFYLIFNQFCAGKFD